MDSVEVSSWRIPSVLTDIGCSTPCRIRIHALPDPDSVHNRGIVRVQTPEVGHHVRTDNAGEGVAKRVAASMNWPKVTGVVASAQLHWHNVIQFGGVRLIAHPALTLVSREDLVTMHLGFVRPRSSRSAAHLRLHELLIVCLRLLALGSPAVLLSRSLRSHMRAIPREDVRETSDLPSCRSGLTASTRMYRRKLGLPRIHDLQFAKRVLGFAVITRPAARHQILGCRATTPAVWFHVIQRS